MTTPSGTKGSAAYWMSSLACRASSAPLLSAHQACTGSLPPSAAVEPTFQVTWTTFDVSSGLRFPAHVHWTVQPPLVGWGA